MSGLGISGFIKHNDAQNSSRGQWLKQWKKNGKGEICVWLHTRAPIVPCHSHSFMLEDEYEDKETGRTLPVLRFPRFVSPDPEIVHKSQYFRNDDDTLQVPPEQIAEASSHGRPGVPPGLPTRRSWRAAPLTAFQL